jgi:hypothetical protein
MFPIFSQEEIESQMLKAVLYILILFIRAWATTDKARINALE